MRLWAVAHKYLVCIWRDIRYLYICQSITISSIGDEIAACQTSKVRCWKHNRKNSKQEVLSKLDLSAISPQEKYKRKHFGRVIFSSNAKYAHN